MKILLLCLFLIFIGIKLLNKELFTLGIKGTLESEYEKKLNERGNNLNINLR